MTRASIETDSLDPTVDPCDDFYQFACGGWEKSHPIPDDRSQWGRGSVMADANLTRIRKVLDDAKMAPVDDDTNSRRLSDFWETCMDESKAEDLAPLRRELAAIDAIHDAPSLAVGIARLQRLDASIPFSIWAAPDFVDTTQEILHFEQGGLGMPDRDYYFAPATDAAKTRVREAYTKHVAAMLALIGDKNAKKSATTAIAFETKLAEAHLHRVEMRDPKNLYQLVDRAWLDTNAPGFAWRDWFGALGLDAVKSLNVGQPTFFKRFAELLKTTPLADVRTYLRWRLLDSYAPTLGAKIVAEDFAYRQSITGAKALLPRWKRCIRATDNAMAEALAPPLLKTLLPSESRARADATMKSLITAMDAELAQLAWMDDATRAEARAKLHAIDVKLAEPKRPHDFSQLAVGRTSFFDNEAAENKFWLDYHFGRIGKPVDRTEWHTSPATGDCNYGWSKNDITVPGAMLQPPLFGAPMTRAMELGALGTYLGHEITHGFDDQGRKFDARGNERDWWTDASAKQFESRAACVKDHLGGMTFDGTHVDGQLTLGEDIADLGGMKIAWSAFQKAIETEPGNDDYVVSEPRQFFIGYAQWWCRNIRPEALATMLATDPHAPPKARVNATVSNTPAFAQTFACKPKNAMIHAPRCEVW